MTVIKMYVTKVRIMDKITFITSDLELEFSNVNETEKYIRFIMNNRNVLNVIEFKVYRYTKRFASQIQFVYDRHNHVCQNYVNRTMWSVYDDPFLGF